MGTAGKAKGRATGKVTSQRARNRRIVLLALSPVFCLLLAVLIRATLFDAFEMEGPSMGPTLAHRDRFVVSKFSYGLFLPFTDRAALSWADPDRGEVVVLKSPSDGIDIVKRIIGIAGDTIEIRADVVVLNGAPIETRDLGPAEGADETLVCVEELLGETTYRIVRNPESPSHSQPPIAIPAGHVYVLGDDRDRSNDSRFWGPVAVESLKGLYLFHYGWAAARVSCPSS